MINFHYALSRAFIIKQLLDELLDDDDFNVLIEEGTYLSWEVFDNCREQGLVLVLGRENTKRVYFAVTVHRNGDSTRIYEYTDPDFPHNLPKEDSLAWNNSVGYKYNEIYEASEYIKNRLILLLKEKEGGK